MLAKVKLVGAGCVASQMPETSGGQQVEKLVDRKQRSAGFDPGASPCCTER